MKVSTRIVTSDENDIRLDRWLKRHYAALTQGVIQKYCRKGQIRVDGHKVEASSRLHEGQTVRIPPLEEGAAALKSAAQERASIEPKIMAHYAKEVRQWLLYEDESLFVINKPVGLAVQGGSNIAKHVDGMLSALQGGYESKPKLVHRLDRDTSGVLLIARTSGIAARLAELFRGRDIKKTYWAVVVGRPQPAEGVIDLPLKAILQGGEKVIRPAERNDEGAQSALTEYQVRDSAAKRVSWLELSPLTGRTHQLRVHCEALGTPILGDSKYGGKVAFLDNISSQLHLHAYSLDFPHPKGGRLRIAASMPSHMQQTFKTLGFDIPSLPSVWRS